LQLPLLLNYLIVFLIFISPLLFQLQLLKIPYWHFAPILHLSQKNLIHVSQLMPNPFLHLLFFRILAYQIYLQLIFFWLQAENAFLFI
jgi:hypothetical protein